MKKGLGTCIRYTYVYVRTREHGRVLSKNDVAFHSQIKYARYGNIRRRRNILGSSIDFAVFVTREIRHRVPKFGKDELLR